MPRAREAQDGRACLLVGSQADHRVADILDKAGWEVESAAGEQEAATAVERRPWTAVFVAQSVGQGPLQSLILRAGQKRSPPPVVVLGAAATLQEAVDAMQLGAADFIAPPFSSEVLLGRLKRLITASPRPGFDRTDGRSL